MTTFSQTIELVKAGNIEVAFALARTEEGFNQDTTLDQWVAFINRVIEQRANEDTLAKDWYNSPAFA